MNIFMTGGTGFVGKNLSARLAKEGHAVTILKFHGEAPKNTDKNISFIDGDPARGGSWQDALPENDVIINMAGAPIFSKWTNDRKKSIRESRILTTSRIVEALTRSKKKPELFLSTSAVGYYGFRGDEYLREDSPAGDDFLASVAREWEEISLGAIDCGVRVVICRFGIVLGKSGGVLGKMAPIFRYRLGSSLGNGKQWLSWIHEDDLSSIYLFLMENDDIEGPVNCCSPNPVRNREFTRTLAAAINRPVLLPSVPSFIVKAGLGELGNVLLKGQRVLPAKLMKANFDFAFPTIEDALFDIFLN